MDHCRALLRRLHVVAAAACCLPLVSPAQDRILINEIHHNPDAKTERVEFVELFNAGTNTVNLANWFFSDGLDFRFPATNVPPGGYLVVAQDPAALAAKFPGTIALGPFSPDRSSQLSRNGEKLTLCNASGQVIDEVDYGLGFPWPTVGDPPGYSIELVNPRLDNDLGGNWRASASSSAGAAGQVLIQSNSTWKYFKGLSEASTPATRWRDLDFDDGTWLAGTGPIGYGETFVTTPLNDMRSNYTAVFFRKTFVVEDALPVSGLLLQAQYDDGFKVWINGVSVLDQNMTAGEVAFSATALVNEEYGTYRQFSLNNPAAWLRTGTNVIAIQSHNVNRDTSSDFFLDVRLSTQTGGSGRGPTPGRLNSVYASNAPPAVRQVEHTPEQPAAGQVVTITAKVTDPDGVTNVMLQYQVVDPGSYIEMTDPAYTNNWTSIAMNDAGVDGDAVAGDSIYSALLPASLQVHRRLVRYRISVADAMGLSVRVPYADDPQPNFAYFVYNGVPGWRGAARPGVTPVQDFGSNVMSRLPAYHLIARSNTVATATWFSRYGGDLYQWIGTLVYDGKVYDHIHFRARGGVWRYSMVKNMWKFDLNRGHDFVARDNWGRRYKTAWTKLNLGACIQQGDFWHRGEQGMFESVGLRLFGLAGVPAPRTTFVTFRVIDDVNEADPATQYEGDFWGVYLALEQENGRFLEEHDLPDGNLYKMEGGTGELNNLGPEGPTDKSDLNAFLGAYNSATNASIPDAWWRTNLNLPRYYSYQTIVQAIHHYDIADGKNYFYYRNPVSRTWEVVPWDLDLTWADNMYRAGQQGGNEPFKSRVLGDFAIPGPRPAINVEFRNRVREIRDLLWNSEEAYRLIDEYAARLRGPTNGPTILDADRAMWDYNPKMVNSAYTPNLNKAQQGYYYQWTQEPGVTKDFNGGLQVLKNYVAYRATNAVFSLDVISAEPLRPVRPAITYTGPAAYPINQLSFRASTYSGAEPCAITQWRVAEYSTNAPAHDAPEPLPYEIEASWQASTNGYVAEITLPPQAVKVGQRYRVRARFLDAAGRAGNWSLPHEFVCGESSNLAALVGSLRITEIMFNSPLAGYEYVELHNSSGTASLDLSGVKFTQGIDYTFAAGVLLPPGGYLLVVGTPDIAGFRNYYGLDPSVVVFGPYDGKLDNAGEQLTLRTAAGGTDIVSFDYRDSRGWPVSADGAGASLVLVPGAEGQQGSTSGDSGSGEYSGNWRASTYLRGSPGRDDPPALPGIVLNEVAANTRYTNELTSNDWVELYNPTPTNLVLGPGWYLSDDETDLRKWQIPPATTVPALGWVSFDEVAGFHNPPTAGFGLDKDGEQVFLSYLPGTAEDRIVDAVSFKAQEFGRSLGRYPDGAPYWHALAPTTRNAANVAPASDLVISEVMYHPLTGDGTNDDTLDEFIEVFNPTANPVPLFNSNGAWRIDGVAGDGNFLFPSNLTLPAGGYLLVVDFDVNVPAQLAAFRSRYGITNSNLILLGPYEGKLANNSARLALEKPQARDLPGQPPAWVIVDEVIYADATPWPCDTDGTGNSLQRLSAQGHGSDPFNWSGQLPTPGAARSPEPPGLPDITFHPIGLVVPTNSSVAFSVGVCGLPPFYYQWLFNDAPILEATNSMLTLHNVTLANAGSYAVTLSNLAGAVQSLPASLIVQTPPRLVEHPQATTVVRGLTTSFSVTGEGTPPLSYQWEFQGARITDPEGASRTLVLTNVQASQAGWYRAVVYNTAGAVTSAPASLNVLIPATITNQPQSVSVPAGTNVLFSVGATGTGTLRYQWRRDGLAIPGATSATLLLTNVQLSDVGDYSAAVTDDIGSDFSLPAHLEVRVRPFIVQQPAPASLVVPAGASASFTVVAGGSLPLSFRWVQNNAYRTNIVIHGNTCTFTIPNARTNDVGSYKVAITNAFGNAINGWSSVATLTVLEPPIFTTDPTNQTVWPGSNATFYATAAGAAPLGYQWWFNRTNLLIGATNATLSITNALLEQDGDYFCTATNPVGSATSEVARLNLLIPPQILVQPSGLAASVGSNVVLSVVAIGAEPLRYQWFKSSLFLTGETNSTLLLRSVEASAAGDYQVEVANPLGTNLSQAAALSIIGLPDGDADGIPDTWEIAFGLDKASPDDATTDADGDGLNNRQEFLAGTNPTNRTSVLKIDSIVHGQASTAWVSLSFQAISNKSYALQATELGASNAWTTLSNVLVAPSNRVVQITNLVPADATHRLYRLVMPGLAP